MSKEVGAIEKTWLLGRNFSFLGAAVLGAVTLLQGAQPGFALAAGNLLFAGGLCEVGRQLTEGTKKKLGGVALAH